jgi:hypothetical protein
MAATGPVGQQHPTHPHNSTSADPPPFYQQRPGQGHWARHKLAAAGASLRGGLAKVPLSLSLSLSPLPTHPTPARERRSLRKARCASRGLRAGARGTRLESSGRHLGSAMAAGGRQERSRGVASPAQTRRLGQRPGWAPRRSSPRLARPAGGGGVGSPRGLGFRRLRGSLTTAGGRDHIGTRKACGDRAADRGFEGLGWRARAAKADMREKPTGPNAAPHRTTPARSSAATSHPPTRC